MQEAGRLVYQRIQTETSSPAQLILLLYDALEADLRRAERALESSDYPLTHERLCRAQEIVYQLLGSLDLGYGELPARLADLYRYIYRRLIYANVHKDISAVREAASLVRPLAAAWAGVAQRRDAVNR